MDSYLYSTLFIVSSLLSLILCSVFRRFALRFNILDHPSSSIKTHQNSTPYLGGCAIALAFFLSLWCAKNYFSVNFSELQPLKGILYGSAGVILLGLIDDIRVGGLSFKVKFLIQFIVAGFLLLYGIKINFIHPNWFSILLTLIWLVGIMNAMNIIDIMDGLAAGTATIASLAFFFISLPTEHVYVNLAAIILAGACLGFLPYNFSKKWKLFMGDAGSLFIGFVLAALSLGTSYTTIHNAGVLAPILILGIPIYDTVFVMILRLRKGMSPFQGSKDHFALRLEKMGIPRPHIVGLSILVTALSCYLAYTTIHIWFWSAVILYIIIFILTYIVSSFLARVKID